MTTSFCTRVCTAGNSSTLSTTVHLENSSLNTCSRLQHRQGRHRSRRYRYHRFQASALSLPPIPSTIIRLGTRQHEVRQTYQSEYRPSVDPSRVTLLTAGLALLGVGGPVHRVRGAQEADQVQPTLDRHGRGAIPPVSQQGAGEVRALPARQVG